MNIYLTSIEAGLAAGDWEELADEDALDCDIEVDRIGKRSHKKICAR